MTTKMRIATTVRGGGHAVPQTKMTTSAPDAIKQEEVHTAVVEVRKDSLKGYLDGKLLLCDDYTELFRVQVVERKEAGKKLR